MVPISLGPNFFGILLFRGDFERADVGRGDLLSLDLVDEVEEDLKCVESWICT